ncbi:MAG: hypothetical protein HY010_05830 [Acidobacteria bacterium]|nr:hypothetical protein [Acidobacteriota bacterium]
MKRLALWLALLNSLFVVAQANVGMRLPSVMVPKNNTNQCAATPSQSYPCVQDVDIDGVRFTTVGYDAHTRRIKYLFTQDQKFRTGGLRVGGLIDLAENEILPVAGWYTMGPRNKDGWRPIVGSFLEGTAIKSADGEAIDLTKPVAGKMHRFKIIAFDKGGV